MECFYKKVSGMVMGMSGWNRVEMIIGGWEVKKELKSLGDCWNYLGRG